MSDRDFKTYSELFNSMLQFIEPLDLIIYLKANTDTLMSRIKNRNRDYEVDISSEYIHSLNIYYNKWIDKIDSSKVIIFKTDDFNIFKDENLYLDLVKKINIKLKND